MKKIIAFCIVGMIATLFVGIVIGSSFSKEIETITTVTETKYKTATETEYPEGIYAVVEVDDDTYYYDAFWWDDERNIYIRMNDSWVYAWSAFGHVNSGGWTMYGIVNQSWNPYCGWGNMYLNSVLVNQPDLCYCPYDGKDWVNLHEKP